MADERTTYCGIIERELNTPVCPLRKHQCMWQHRETKVCTYDDSVAHPEEEKNRISPAEFAERVGLPVLPSALVYILKQSLTHNLKKSI
jgi:hypothetical protein